MKNLVTVSNALIVGFLEGLPWSEEDKGKALADVGLSREQIADIYGRLSFLTATRLWKNLVRLSGDPFLALRIGSVVPGERFGLAVHAAQNSDTFREVLRRFCKYARLINDLMKCTLEEEGGIARFSMNFFWDILDMERQAVDLTFMGTVKWGREHLGSRLDLREVRVKHVLWSAERPYRELFQVPVVFGAKRNELIMGAQCLDERVSGANSELGCILNRHASSELAHTPTVESLPARVLNLINIALEVGRTVDLVSLALVLKMSPRHLQRQLADSSTSFTALLDEARKALAPALLAKPSANVEQVGFQLGYSEPTAFIRAFKKWYGATPGQVRRLNG